ESDPSEIELTSPAELESSSSAELGSSSLVIDDRDEIAELHSNLNRCSHTPCEWKVGKDYASCKLQEY
ncbi:hypothetical protein BGZ99_006756, partial [Dissophora globulifera]